MNGLLSVFRTTATGVARTVRAASFTAAMLLFCIGARAYAQDVPDTGDVAQTVTSYVEFSWMNWLVAGVTFAFFLFLRRLLTVFINRKLKAIADEHTSGARAKLLKEMQRSASMLLLFVSIWVALLLVPIPEVLLFQVAKKQYFLRDVLGQVNLTLMIFFGARFFNWVIETAIYFARRRAMDLDPDNRHTVDDVMLPLLRDALKVFIWIVTILMLVSIWGFNITTLVAGLGIGGLAIAFAAQDTISNVFGSVTVLLDKPFEVGDWVKIDSFEGTVEEVGMRSTRIRTSADTVVTLPNSKITSSIVENFSRMKKRRVNMRVTLPCWTSPEGIGQFIDGAREILASREDLHPDGQTVVFDEFGTGVFSILLNYYTLKTDWQSNLEIRQSVNLELLRLARKLGLDVAHPVAVELNAPLNRDVG